METAIPEIRFTSEPLEHRDELVRLFRDRLRRMMLERVATSGRELVMDEDFRACAPDAFREALAEMGLPNGPTQEEAGD